MFKAANYDAPHDFSGIRMTVDETADLDAIRLLVKQLGPNEDWKTYTKFIVENFSRFPNQKIQRNEGYIKSLLED